MSEQSKKDKYAIAFLLDGYSAFEADLKKKKPVSVVTTVRENNNSIMSRIDCVFIVHGPFRPTFMTKNHELLG